MKLREAEKCLSEVGLSLERRKRHRVWRCACGDLFVSLHRGNKVNSQQWHTVKRVLRKAKVHKCR